MAGATYQEVLQARIVMEPVMARLAALRQDRAALGQLEQFLKQNEPSDEAEYLLQVGGFHGLVSELSGNRVLDLQARALRDIYADRIEGTVFSQEVRTQITKQHEQIARAIMSGDAARAEELMRAHMEEHLFYSAGSNPGVLDEVIQWR
jgi:DNA-binding FadR family transcriptional regulator